MRLPTVDRLTPTSSAISRYVRPLVRSWIMRSASSVPSPVLRRGRRRGGNASRTLAVARSAASAGSAGSATSISASRSARSPSGARSLTPCRGASRAALTARRPAIGLAVEHLTVVDPAVVHVPVEEVLAERVPAPAPRDGTAVGELRGDGVGGAALVVGRTYPDADTRAVPRVRHATVHGLVVHEDAGQVLPVGEVQPGDVGGAVPHRGERLAPGGDLRPHLHGRDGAQGDGARPAASGLGAGEPTARDP